LVAYLASGAADVLSGRNILATGDMAQMAVRAAEIEGHDLYVLREREELNTHPPTPVPRRPPAG
jgi:hypothetical protein